MAATSALTAEHIRRLERIRQREEAAFRSRVTTSLGLDLKAREVMPHGVPMAWMAGLYRTPPLWVSHGSGATFTDVDGNDYLDFNICDMSAVLGYAHPRLATVISEQALRGVQFFLPVEPAFAVCEQLRLRFGLPKWQFTLAATSANVEALRIARLATGRAGVLLFGGKYHGHLDDTLWTQHQGNVGARGAGHRARATLGPHRRGLQRPGCGRAGAESAKRPRPCSPKGCSRTVVPCCPTPGS